jgi:hypothetical protein
MAQAIQMDTLEASDTLQSVGFEKKQADTLIRIVNAQRQDIDLSHLATKEDLNVVKQDLAGVKQDLADTKYDILKWMIGAMGAQTAIILAVIRLF